MSIQPADIKQAILDEDDFGHEMRVGHIFDSISYPDEFNTTRIETPEHGGTYTDSVTGKPRQFDYRCHILADPMPRTQTGKCALLAVECKNLHESSPLVMCGRARQTEEAYHTFVMSQWEKRPIHYNPPPVVKKAAKGLSLFKEGEFVGKSLLRLRQTNGQMKSDNQSDIYDRWAQALASSVELAEIAASLAQRHEQRQYFGLVMPLVVVPDGSLWTVMYDAAGNIPKDPVQAEKCDFFVERKIPIRGTSARLILTHIHFVTLKGFSELLSSFVRERRKWDRLFPDGATNLET